jgi:hypothetical protein
MNENVLQIEPQKGLGFFKLDSNLNFIISEVRSRGERYEHADIVVGETGTDRSEAIFLILNKEGIKFRFDQIYQRLEMIEIDMKNIYKERRHSLHYKNHILINPLNSVSGIGSHIHIENNTAMHVRHNSFSNPVLNYNYIITIFGLSSIPKIIDNNKYILLRYNGISFLFENNENISVPCMNTSITEDNFNLSYFSEAILIKISIFTENFLIDSISRENHLYKVPVPLIKVDIDKGIFITLEGSNTNTNISQVENENISSPYDIYIPYGESLQNILFNLKNPNFIYYKSNDNFDTNEYDSDNSFLGDSSPSYYCNKEDQDFILNYYSMGLDIVIDSTTHTAKKFILHTNNPFDVKFGVYNKCNFNIELNKNFFKKLEKINETNSLNDRESMNIGNTNTMGNMGNNNSNPNNNFYTTACTYTPSNKSRKVSEDSTNKIPFHSNSDEKGDLSINMNMNISYSDNIAICNDYNNTNTPGMKIEKTNNFLYENKRGDEYSGLGYKDHYIASINNTTKDDNIQLQSSNYYARRKRTEYLNQKLSIESREMINPGEKSFCSMNESNISISLNTSDIFMNMNILPNTNFAEILNRFPPNSFFVYLKQEPKLNMTSKYYAFDGVIFEVLENQSVASVTLFKPLLKC